MESTEQLIVDSNDKFDAKVKETELLKENHKDAEEHSNLLKKEIDNLKGEIGNKVCLIHNNEEHDYTFFALLINS